MREAATILILYTFAGVEDSGLSGSHSMPGGTATWRHGNQTLTLLQ